MPRIYSESLFAPPGTPNNWKKWPREWCLMSFWGWDGVTQALDVYLFVHQELWNWYGEYVPLNNIRWVSRYSLCKTPYYQQGISQHCSLCKLDVTGYANVVLCTPLKSFLWCNNTQGTQQVVMMFWLNCFASFDQQQTMLWFATCPSCDFTMITQLLFVSSVFLGGAQNAAIQYWFFNLVM